MSSFYKRGYHRYDDVYNFGKNLDALTIEIENVNIDALEQLEKEGKRIFPKPQVLRIICNKVRQKQYYADYNIPTSEFVVTQKFGRIKTIRALAASSTQTGARRVRW